MVHDILDKIALLKKLKAEMDEDRKFYAQRSTISGSDTAYGVQTCINKLDLELVNLEAEFKYHEEQMWDQYQQEHLHDYPDCVIDEHLDRQTEADLDDMHLAMAETALAKDWLTPEEDEAWKNLEEEVE